MELTLRRISGSDSPPPGNGEIYVQQAAADANARRDLAMLVLHEGVKCLRQGTGPIERIVVDADPTLDDLLAATFAGELLAGRALPAGAEAFARYAALVREGHIPSKLPLENSLEGLFLAIRNIDGDDLTKSEVAARFTERWHSVAEVILRAARDGVNPFTTSVVGEGSEFAREQMFLERDHEVYCQDMARGEQWDVAIPGGPPHGRALLLRQPKSLLFKQWSRRTDDSWAGGAFILLAVDWGEGSWVFSTDPVMQIPINRLAELLQEAEVAINAQSAADDPWFDGKPFGHTLVAAPRHGTKLSEADLMAIVHRWSDAARNRHFSISRLLPGISVVAVCLLAGVGWGLHALQTAGSSRGLEFLTVSEDSVNDKITTPRTGSDYALFFATDNYKDWGKLCNAKADAEAIQKMLEDHYGYQKDHVKYYPDCTQKDMIGALNNCLKQKFGPDDQLLIYIAGHGERVGSKGYLVAQDSLKPISKDHADDPEILLHYIDLATVRDDVEKIQALGCGHVFLMMDTCFAGMIDFDPATEEPGHRGSAAINWTPEKKAEIVRRKMQHPCCMFLTSVGDNQTASDGTVHSPFAQDLLDLLKTPPPGGIVTFPHILGALLYSKQEPRYGPLRDRESNGDFLFVWQH